MPDNTRCRRMAEHGWGGSCSLCRNSDRPPQLARLWGRDAPWGASRSSNGPECSRDHERPSRVVPGWPGHCSRGPRRGGAQPHPGAVVCAGPFPSLGGAHTYSQRHSPRRECSHLPSGCGHPSRPQPGASPDRRTAGRSCARCGAERTSHNCDYSTSACASTTRMPFRTRGTSWNPSDGIARTSRLVLALPFLAPRSSPYHSVILTGGQE